MGAHREVDLPRGQGGPGPFLLRRRHGAGEQAHPHPGGSQKLGQGLEMLLGQHFGGGHEGGLTAAPGAQPAGVRGHGGLARAHVPLDQPVHGTA